MKYVNAEAILPKELLNELQKYAQGELIYIPKPKAAYKEWGTCSGSRLELTRRNDEIRRRYRSGEKTDQLAQEYFLSVESIKKIIYKK